MTISDKVWERVYNLDGIGLADYLNGFANTQNEFHSTQHGEKVYFEEEFSFWDWSSWSKFREQVTYYFAGLMDEIESNKIEMTEDQICEILVYISGLNSGLFHVENWGEIVFERPTGYDKFSFM